MLHMQKTTEIVTNNQSTNKQHFYGQYAIILWHISQSLWGAIFINSNLFTFINQHHIPIPALIHLATFELWLGHIFLAKFDLCFIFCFWHWPIIRCRVLHMTTATLFSFNLHSTKHQSWHSAIWSYNWQTSYTKTITKIKLTDMLHCNF